MVQRVREMLKALRGVVLLTVAAGFRGLSVVEGLVSDLASLPWG